MVFDMKKLFLLILMFGFVGCSEQSAYESNLSLVKTIENSGQTQSAFWLEQNTMGTWAKEVLVFGYIDNYAGCLDFVEVNVQKYGGNSLALRQSSEQHYSKVFQ